MSIEHLAIEGTMTVDSALAMRDRLSRFLQSGDELELDLSRVTAIDTAGLQLLLAASREAAKTNKQLRLARPGRCIVEALAIVNLPLDTMEPATDPGPG